MNKSEEPIIGASPVVVKFRYCRLYKNNIGKYPDFNIKFRYNRKMNMRIE